MPDHTFFKPARSLSTLTLTELIFSDDFQTVQQREPKNGRNKIGPLPEETTQSLTALAAAIQDRFEHATQQHGESTTKFNNSLDLDIHESNTIRILIHDGLRLKIRKIDTVGGPVYHCRRMKPLPHFGTITGIHERFRNAIITMARNAEPGLYILSGLPSSGTTTTLLSLVCHIMMMNGDLGLLIEDQPEYKLNKIFEQSGGRLIQRQLNISGNDELYNRQLDEIIAISPRFVTIGDIKTPKHARLATDLASAGLPVYSTIKSPDIISALSSLIHKAGSSGNATSGHNIIANTLRCIIHQTRTNDPNPKDPSYNDIRTDIMIVPASINNTSIATLIKTDQYQQLGQFIGNQLTRVMNNQDPLERIIP